MHQRGRGGRVKVQTSGKPDLQARSKTVKPTQRKSVSKIKTRISQYLLKKEISLIFKYFSNPRIL